MWNQKHAAHRYFRRKGATIDPKNKAVIIHRPVDTSRPEVYKKHADTMKEKKYDFSNSLFLNLDQT
jgi:hypothetical protein